jgi:hypothetical protein
MSHPLMLCAGSLMVFGLSCLMEELRHALPRRPTSYERWDVGPRGADLVETEPQHLVRVGLGH